MQENSLGAKERGYVDGYPVHSQNAESASSATSLYRVWGEVLILKWRIVSIVLVCLFFSILFASHMQPSYKSNILLKVESSSGGVSQAGNLASMMSRVPFLGGTRINSTVYEKTLISSSYILGRVIEKLGLDVRARPHYFPIIGKWFARDYKGAGVARSKFGLTSYAWGGQQIKIGSLKVNSAYINQKMKLIAEKNGHYTLYNESGQKILTGVVGKLAASSKINPAVSLSVDSLVANPGDIFNIRKIDVDSVIAALQKKYKAVDPGVEDGGRGYNTTGLLKVQYSSSSSQETTLFLNTLADTAYSSGAQLLSEQASQTLGFLQMQLPKTKKKLKEAESALSIYQAKSGNMNMSQQFLFFLRELSTRQAALESLKLSRTELLQKYTASHPYMITLNQKISEVKASVNALEVKLHKLPISDKKSVELLRNVKTQDKLYLALLGRQQELKILKAGVRSNIRILNYAAEPALMVKPKKLPIYLFGLIVGLMLSLGYVLLRVAMDNKVTDADAIEEVFGLDVNAIIPYSAKQRNLTNAMKEGCFETGKSSIIAELYPNDIVVEALRSFRTNVRLNLNDKSAKVFSICSLTPGVGKSFISINMAYMLSELGIKVLLIDADLRKGYLHSYMRVDKSPGLTDLLTEKASLHEVVSNYPSTNLHFISKGSHESRTADLLASLNMQKLMSEVRRHYDVIVVDTAPILLLTDGILAAKQSDMNFMILAAGKHTVKEVKAGLDLFSRNKLTAPGVLMNFYDKKKQSSYQYYHYGYSYRNDSYYTDAEESPK
ncbi:MAG: polysaccharide biosynthesis tyrosine autokinase [Gammaproteobacteria bacterium]|nr:polysaccharide biosynthesis tyrosine autokinase [Gammaproteobacteria bacterium]